MARKSEFCGDVIYGWSLRKFTFIFTLVGTISNLSRFSFQMAAKLKIIFFKPMYYQVPNKQTDPNKHTGRKNLEM